MRRTNKKDNLGTLVNPSAALLLGWDDGDTQHVGFRRPSKAAPIYHDQIGHLMTLGATGSGKAVSASMPELLTFRGNALVLDTKAELYHVTSRWRRSTLGHRIILLDPFDVVETPNKPADGLNPLDLASLLGCSRYEAACTIATLFMGTTQQSAFTRGSTNDEFWQDQGTQLLVGLLGAAMEQKLTDSNSFSGIRALLKSDDAVYAMAVMLDANSPSELFKAEIATFLQTVEVTRSGILSTLTSHFRGIAGAGVERMLGQSTFDLASFVHNRLPATIYFVVPPEQLVAQSRLVRLVMGTLLTALYTRRYIPAQKTLVQLDEAGTLGQFEPLRTGITLLRGNGVILHPLFQDIDQVFANYRDAKTIINNTSVVRMLGASNYWQASALADLFGAAPKTLMNLDPSEQLLLIRGVPKRCRRVDYLRDKLFVGRFDPNPRYADPNELENGSHEQTVRPR